MTAVQKADLMVDETVYSMAETSVFGSVVEKAASMGGSSEGHLVYSSGSP